MSYIVETAQRVDAVMARAVKAGATILEPPHTAAWGGYIGYFVAPDRNLRKVVSHSRSGCPGIGHPSQADH